MLTTEQIEEINVMIAALKRVERDSVSGVDTDDLRFLAVHLRNFNDDLIRIWQLAGFKNKQPYIKGLKLDLSMLDSSSYAKLFGGIDHNPDRSYEPLINPTKQQIFERMAISGYSNRQLGIAGIGTTNQSGDVVFQHQGNVQMVIQLGPNNPEIKLEEWVNSNSDNQVSLPLNDYLNGCMVFDHGLKISRWDVIRYICYARHGVHFGKPNVRSKKKQRDDEIFASLKKLSEQQEENRDAVFFMFLSICQEIVSSEDIRKFMAWKP